MSKKLMTVLCMVFVLSFIVAACGEPQYEPHPINEETDRCAICNMAIKDDQFATQIITKDSQPIKFDDIGCMYEWIAQNGTDTIGVAFVRDYNSKVWIKLEEATFVYDASIQTPMAYGVLSFESEESAKQFIDEHGAGTLMNAQQLADHTWESNMEHSHDHSHDHSHGSSSDNHAGHGDAAHHDEAAAEEHGA